MKKLIFLCLVFTGVVFALRAQTASGSLPVVLVELDATVASDQTVTLTMTTHHQTSADRFFAERSTDGINWTIFSGTTSTGENDKPVTYTIKDPFPVEGTLYYRIRFVSPNGNVGYTVVRSVAIARRPIIVYPNPSSDYVLISLPATAPGPWTLSFHDAQGKQIGLYRYPGGETCLRVSVSRFQTGIYTMLLRSSTRTEQRSLVINHP
ncbi:MAG: T9SS type A sorting domain-containing protein [Bacteroidota bacterium]|nr:T9SS type A sorting domain-containing protein [Bacteroidota bacterium]